MHERSISAPGTAGAPAIPRSAKYTTKHALGRNAPWPVINATATKRKSLSPRQLSPRSLAPLVIPPHDAGYAAERQDSARGTDDVIDESDEGTPPAPPPKSRWMEERALATARRPTTPADMSSLSLASNNSNEIPITAPEGGYFTRPWGTPTRNRSPETQGHLRQQSEGAVMDRGRPTQRKMTIEGIRETSPGNSIRTDASADLPCGIPAMHVPSNYSHDEVILLQQQAREQADQFEVLTLKDVECMSRVSWDSS